MTYTPIHLQDEKSLKEANDFVNLLDKSRIAKNYKLIENKPDIYKYKLITANFRIIFKNDFCLTIFKRMRCGYSFKFCSTLFKDSYVPFVLQDYDFHDFGIFCDLYDDVYFECETFYPKNFKETYVFKTYYTTAINKKTKKEIYLIKSPEKYIEFIKDNYDLIKQKVHIEDKDEIKFIKDYLASDKN